MAHKSDRSRQSGGQALQHRIEKMRAQSLKPMPTEMGDAGPFSGFEANAWVDCGWGRLYFAQTYSEITDMVDALREEKPERRDIAFYVRDPHVALSLAPMELFLDPSHTYRLELHTYKSSARRFSNFHIRRLSNRSDAEGVNRIYASRNMVQVDPSFFWDSRDSRNLTHFVAEDDETGDLIGTVTGVDHRRAFNDPERGSSLWCLAVDPQSSHPGIGEALVRRLAEHFQTRGAAFMDLSVLHDNEQAISLYEKLGFMRVPFFALKRKNPINEKLFAGPSFETGLNPYALIIVNEARRRGIQVDVLDAEAGYFRLSFGGRSIVCRESLTELTTAIAMSRCDDKGVTMRLLRSAGLNLPDQIKAASDKDNHAFLKQHGSIVVKPARGEQGQGISVDITNEVDLDRAMRVARRFDDTVLLEQFCAGDDLRILVIGFACVAAAIRRPAAIVGDGVHSIHHLIERQSRRRMAATGGESRIPLDQETVRTIAKSNYKLDSILPANEHLIVRNTANLHTGGTLHDVTDKLHPALRKAAIACARVIDIPVVGIDMIVKDPEKPDYVIIEANERPGLANHEPQPTAERFMDLLFPHSAMTDYRSDPDIEA